MRSGEPPYITLNKSRTCAAAAALANSVAAASSRLGLGDPAMADLWSDAAGNGCLSRHRGCDPLRVSQGGQDVGQGFGGVELLCKIGVVVLENIFESIVRVRGTPRDPSRWATAARGATARTRKRALESRTHATALSAAASVRLCRRLSL